MNQRVLAAWTGSDLHGYPDYVTITREAERVMIKVRGSDGSAEVTQVTMTKDEFMRLAIHALSQVII